MRSSRRSLVALLLLCGVAAVVGAAVAWHRRDAKEDLSWPMAQLGLGIYLYSQEHQGKTPPTVDALVAADMVSEDFPRRLRDKIHYLAAGRDLASLPPNAVVAVQDPTRYAEHAYVNALLANGSVVAVTRESVVAVPLRPDVLLFVEGQSSYDFRITTSPAAAQPATTRPAR